MIHNQNQQVADMPKMPHPLYSNYKTKPEGHTLKKTSEVHSRTLRFAFSHSNYPNLSRFKALHNQHQTHTLLTKDENRIHHINHIGYQAQSQPQDHLSTIPKSREKGPPSTLTDSSISTDAISETRSRVPTDTLDKSIKDARDPSEQTKAKH